ncbi:DUF3630 family protein [Ekhidna sp.]
MKEIKLSNDSSVELFLQYALQLEALGAEFTEKVTGLDQRYWDFLFKGEEYTLHLEHYLGISIFGEIDLPDTLISLLKE